MSFQRIHDSSPKNSQTSSNHSPFATRPFPVQKPQRPQTPEELEKQAFEQDKFEAMGLEVKETRGTITSEESEQLIVLQAKMDSFLQRQWDAVKGRPNLLDIAINNYQAAQQNQSVKQIQPSLLPNNPIRANSTNRSSAPLQPQPNRVNSTPSPTVSLQAKLTVGQPNDQYEQEADRVAERVMSMSPPSTPNIQRQGQQAWTTNINQKPIASSITPLVSRKPESEEEETIQAKCETCEQEEQIQRSPNLLQASSDGTTQAQPSLESRLNATKGGGSPLADGVRNFMEPRFGADFSQVRVHTGSEAVQMNRELGAQAFANGSDIYYGAGKAPGNNELTAHELTHVVQQTGRVQTKQVSEQPTVKYNDVVTEITQAPSSINLQRDCAESPIPDAEQTVNVLYNPDFNVFYISVERLISHHLVFRSDEGQRVRELTRQALYEIHDTTSVATGHITLGFTFLRCPETRRVEDIQLREVLDESTRRDIQPDPIPEQETPRDARAVLDFIKRQARTRAQMPYTISTSSRFFTRLRDYYLQDYLANPSRETGQTAIQRIGRPMEGRVVPAMLEMLETQDSVFVTPQGGQERETADRWERGAIKFWNHESIPEIPNRPLFRNLAGLPRNIGAATDILTIENRQLLPFIDAPFLLGADNFDSSDDMADVRGGGRNLSQLMHWATGVGNAQLSEEALHELFLLYEMWHLEGWDVFGEDSINDLIAEEQGRLLGQELNRGAESAIQDEESLAVFLNSSFQQARAWVGKLLRQRESELEQWILAETQPRAAYHRDQEARFDAWEGRQSIRQMLGTQTSMDDILSSTMVNSQIEIYRLLYESEIWEQTHGEVELTELEQRLLRGELNHLLDDAAQGNWGSLAIGVSSLDGNSSQ